MEGWKNTRKVVTIAKPSYRLGELKLLQSGSIFSFHFSFYKKKKVFGPYADKKVRSAINTSTISLHSPHKILKTLWTKTKNTHQTVRTNRLF